MSTTENLSKMKVADLKKHLKSIGLPISGNKTELVERLQEALKSGNSALDSSGAADEDEFDEEEILGDVEDDGGKITQEEEAAALSGNLKDALLGSATPKPEKKKVSLKRSTPSLSQPTESSNGVTEEVAPPTEDKSKSTTTVTTEEDTSTSEPKHKTIKLSQESSEKSETPKSKVILKITGPETDETRKEARAARFGASLGDSGSRPSKLSMETGGTDMGKLKKRAERFGEVTSKTLSKLEMLEKMKERKSRFGSEDEKSDVDSDAAKSARADRFNLTENGTKEPVNSEEAKKKRAERFAAK